MMPNEGDRQSNAAVSFGPFKLSMAQRLLERDGTPIPLGGRALDILIVLVEHANEIVTKDELLKRVWPNINVGEGSLRVHVAALRKALGDGEGDARYLATLTGRGYSFVAPVALSNEARPVARAVQMPEQLQKLPARSTRMVGRDEIVHEISQRLEADRFVTVAGPGGIGKTTVAVAVARHLLENFAGDACFFDLGPLSDPLLVPGVVASTLGLSVRSSDPVPAIISFLRDRRALLVLDSCEHVIDVTAALAERIYAEAPTVHILATSRESLRVGGEQVYRLPPLSAPTSTAYSAASALDFPAVRLFVDRMSAGGRPIELNNSGAAIVCEICHRLDGLALAIELAAGHVNTYGLQGTLDLLADRFNVIQGGRRTALPRHQTLRATLDWSYDLLSQAERLILRRLAVFAGPFGLEVALSVVVDDQIDRAQAMNGLASLVDKSLIAVCTGSATSRSPYRLLDTTRRYAAAKLTESGEADRIGRRHADCYRELFEQTDAGSTAYADHLDNVRAALEWSFSESGDTRIGVALAAASSRLFLEMLLLAECQQWAEQAISAFEEVDLGTWREMKLQAALGQSLMFARGNDDRARRSLVRGLKLAEDLQDVRTQLRLLGRLGLFDHRTRDTSNALLLATRSAEVAARIGDPACIAEANWNLGFFNYYSGDLLTAEKNWKACLSASTMSGIDPENRSVDRDTRVRARCGFAAIRWLRGFPEEATTITKEAIAEEATFKDPSTLCICLLFAGATLLRIGNRSDAEEVIERLIAKARSYSFAPYEAAGIGFRGMLSIGRGQVEAGIATLRRGVEMLHANRQELQVPVLLGGLAEGLAASERFDEALAIIDEAIAKAEQNKESFFSLAEFWRIKGEILLSASASNVSAADGCFLQAIEEAGRQGALSWELRAATSLARSHVRQNRLDEARSLLTRVYDRFTEGFGSCDLRAARSLLDKIEHLQTAAE